MFTGIVEEIGAVERIQKGRHSAALTIQADRILEDIKIGDSIAVNGVCLTVTSYHTRSFTADVMHETLNRSALALLKTGNRVNLERAMPVNGRFGGHMVAGHVDGIGKITEIRRDDTAVWYTVQAEPSALRYIIEKGSVAIDGISLTVAKRFSDCFSISVIPHTVQVTNLRERKKGDLVNLENDMIGKYVECLLGSAGNMAGGAEVRTHLQTSNMTKDFLTRCGY